MNILNKAAITALIILGTTVSMAQSPKEPISLNSSYNESQVSSDVLGLGNKILDQAGKSKYLKFDLQGTEYAYVINRFADGDIKYTGNEADIKGVRFLEVKAYKDGFELPIQVSSYSPSKYNNAIRIVKKDRNDERPYEFDIGMDSEKRLYIIESQQEVTYLEQVDTIKTYVPRKDKKSKYAF